MKTYTKFLVTFLTMAVIAVNGCAPSPTLTPASPTATAVPPTPTSIPLRNLLQLENNLPQTRLSPRSSQELQDNHIGIHAEDYGRYKVLMEQVRRNGFKWIRIQSLTEFWGEGYGPSTFSLESIPPEVDSAISGYIANGVNIVLDLVLGSGVKINYTEFNTTFQSQEEIDRYLEHVKFVVSHFKGRIQYYQILNEPGYITVETYANVIRQVVPVIREEDRNAKIIIGGMWGRWENGYPGYGEYQRFSLAVDYLNELLRSGVVDMVDGISWHPLYDNIPGDPYYQDYPQIVQSIKDLAASQGFTGEYFADEILWQTVDEPDWDNGPPITPSIAGKYFTRAITEHRGLGVNVTINTWFIEPENGNAPKGALTPIHNLCDTLAGAEPTSIALSLETDGDANMRSYAFILPDGDRLLALWTNDEAVEEDPGVNTTLKLTGSSAQGVTGIDVFYGFEQELVAETESGDLVIRNLLVKDYPIILRFSEASFAEPGVTETPSLAPFSGEWEGTDPVDGSIITLSLAQTGNSLTGTYKDTFSPNVNPPGYEGNGSGVVLSDSTAQITFDLFRWDGKTVQLQLFLTFSDQNNTLTLDCEVGCPIVMQRQ